MKVSLLNNRANRTNIDMTYNAQRWGLRSRSRS